MKPAFLSALWNHPLNTEGWQLFQVGTCHGQWRATAAAYEILSILNHYPGNGDFDIALEYFHISCERDHRNLLIREVWNKDLKKHLLDKRGFVPHGTDDVIKRFVQ